MKKIGILILLITGAAFCSAQTTVSLEMAINDCSQYLRRQLPRGTRIAIMPISARTDELSLYATDKLSSKVVNDGNLVVVERRQDGLKAAEKEIFYQMSTLAVSDETASSIGRQFGAQMIVSGNISRLRNVFRLTIRVLHVETAQVQGQWEIENIRADEDLVKLATPIINATVVFAGSAIREADKDTLFESLELALQDYGLTVQLVPEWVIPENDDKYTFVITVRMNRPAQQSRAALITGDLTLSFTKNGRSLRQGIRQSVSEMGGDWFIRRSGEYLRGNKAFFQGLTEALIQ